AVVAVALPGAAWHGVGMLGVVGLLGLALAGGLLLALAQQFFHQGLVGQRRLQVGLAFQGLLIGVHGRFQLASPGQGVTAIVMGGSRVAQGEAVGRFGIVAGFVKG